MVTFHGGNPGVPTHDARTCEGDRPRLEILEAERSPERYSLLIDVEDQSICGNPIWADANVKAVCASFEVIDGESVVVRCAAITIKDLNEGMLPAGILVEKDAGDDGEPVLLVPINELEIPSLKERWALPTPVIDRWLED